MPLASRAKCALLETSAPLGLCTLWPVGALESPWCSSTLFKYNKRMQLTRFWPPVEVCRESVGPRPALSPLTPGKSTADVSCYRAYVPRYWSTLKCIVSLLEDRRWLGCFGAIVLEWTSTVHLLIPAHFLIDSVLSVSGFRLWREQSLSCCQHFKTNWSSERWIFFFVSLAFSFFPFSFSLLICEAASERTALWQDLINHGTAQAKSPCCLAQIQEETVMVVNQRANGVGRGQVGISLFFTVYWSNQTCLLTTGSCSCYAPVVVKKLKSAIKYFPPSLLFLLHFFPVYLRSSQRRVALSFLFRGYLHLSPQVWFFCFLSAFLWSLLHSTSAFLSLLCPLSVLCLCCFCLAQMFVDVFVVKETWKMEHSFLAAFQTNNIFGNHAK